MLKMGIPQGWPMFRGMQILKTRIFKESILKGLKIQMVKAVFSRPVNYLLGPSLYLSSL